jgi:hypothetical protein
MELAAFTGGRGLVIQVGFLKRPSWPRPYENHKNGNSGMQLSWFKPAGNWCLLAQVDSIPAGDYGVFVIWHNGAMWGEVITWSQPIAVNLPAA